MLERDPHGNVQVCFFGTIRFSKKPIKIQTQNRFMLHMYVNQVAKIETEKMLIQMVETELEKKKKDGSYKREFMGKSHFFGYIT